MTDLTPAHLREIMPNIPQDDEVTEFPACCATMRRFDITNKRRAAAWLGNVAKESGELFFTEEIASGAAYEGRLDLGNTHPVSGMRFKGRGYIDHGPDELHEDRAGARHSVCGPSGTPQKDAVPLDHRRILLEEHEQPRESEPDSR